MTKGLPVHNVVNVSINRMAKASPNRNFGSLLIVGSSEVISIDERLREYTTIDSVISDFGIDAKEYEAAKIYFSQSPKPNQLYIGRRDKGEKLDQCIAILSDMSTNWYGLIITDEMAENEIFSIAQMIESDHISRIFGINLQDKNCLLSNSKDDIAYKLKKANLSRTLAIYSSSSPYAIASLFGRAFSVNFNGNNTTITLKFKQLPTITAEIITQNQAQTLKKKNCNVFVEYDNETMMIQEGVMCDGRFIDEIHGLDWLANHVQTNVWNLLYTSNTKIAQTDQGVNKILARIEQSLAQAVNNNLISEGIWNGDPIGSLNTGDMLTKGYYVYAQSVNTQMQADREARKAPVIQCAIKLAGAIHSTEILINVNA